MRRLIEIGRINFLKDLICCGNIYPVILAPIDLLIPHEDIEYSRFCELAEDITRRRIIEKPILVDMNTMIILDGHHRYHVFKELGKEKIPALLIDYNDPCIRVESWRSDWFVNKELVIKTGLERKLLPHKTSRHILCFEIPRIDLSIDLIP